MATLTAAALKDAFGRLGDNPDTSCLFDSDPVFVRPGVAHYCFDGFMDCYLVAEGDQVIDAQDCGRAAVDSGDLAAYRRFDSLDAWATQVMAELAL